MKKLKQLLLCITVLFSLTGCQLANESSSSIESKQDTLIGLYITENDIDFSQQITNNKDLHTTNKIYGELNLTDCNIVFDKLNGYFFGKIPTDINNAEYIFTGDSEFAKITANVVADTSETTTAEIYYNQEYLENNLNTRLIFYAFPVFLDQNQKVYILSDDFDRAIAGDPGISLSISRQTEVTETFQEETKTMINSYIINYIPNRPTKEIEFFKVDSNNNHTLIPKESLENLEVFFDEQTEYILVRKQNDEQIDYDIINRDDSNYEYYIATEGKLLQKMTITITYEQTQES